jgi:hypothetical protein
MAARAAGLNRTAMSGVRGLPQPLTDGGPGYTPNRNNAPVYSAAGLSHELDAPYAHNRGYVDRSRLGMSFAAPNPESIDPALGTTLQAGGSGFMSRGALAFLGAGFNPWARESHGAESVASPQSGAQLDQLFSLAQQMGIDTSKYTREQSRELYDELNNMTKDYVSVGGLSQGWAGNGSTVGRTIYLERDGRLLPVTRPEFHRRQTNNGFFSRDFWQAAATTLLPAFGGWAGLLGQTGATAGLSGTALTTANAGINALGSYAMSGGNPRSLIGGLGGVAGGTIGGLAGGYDRIGATLGRQIGQLAARRR